MLFGLFLSFCSFLAGFFFSRHEYKETIEDLTKYYDFKIKEIVQNYEHSER